MPESIYTFFLQQQKWVAKKPRRDRTGGAKCPNRGRRRKSAGLRSPEGDFWVIPFLRRLANWHSHITIQHPCP